MLPTSAACRATPRKIERAAVKQREHLHASGVTSLTEPTTPCALPFGRRLAEEGGDVTTKKPKKKAKDLDPTGRSADVKGGAAKIVPGNEQELRAAVNRVGRKIGPSR